MKRLLAILMTLAMIAMAFGCSVPGQETEEPAATEAAEATGTTEAEATAAPVAEATEAAASGTSIKVALSTEPISMDPHVGNDSNTSTALMLAYEGLLNVVNGEIQPGMAESYEVSEDGTVYTFHLRDAKWSDGQPVTASDFADTYKRMLTRQDAMDLAYLIFPIKNAQAVNAGEVDVSELGVEVVDDKTLVITLEAAYPFMVTLFASTPMMPIRNDMAEELQTAYGSDVGKFVCNGPYIMTEWAHSDRMVFEKNPDYWNADAINIEEVTLLLVSDANTMKNMYDTGDIYFMQLGSDMIEAYKDQPDFQYYTSGGVTFIALSFNGMSEETAKIIQNRNFVNALSAAIDRQGLVDAMYPTNEPFTGVINPVISDELGGTWGDHAEYDVKDVYHKTTADVEAAKAYMQTACEELGYASAEDMPTFDFFTTSGEQDRTLCEYFQNVWLSTLGVKTEIRQLEFAQYWECLYNQPYDIVRTGWGPDYDDPFTYLDMWDSRGGWNKTGWSSDEYNNLITEANQQSDFATRNDMFSEAEKILLTEAPIIPLYMSRGALVMSDKIENVSINTFGARFDFRYATISE